MVHQRCVVQSWTDLILSPFSAKYPHFSSLSINFFIHKAQIIIIDLFTQYIIIHYVCILISNVKHTHKGAEIKPTWG